jgi:translation elongation factor EF-1alpha
MRRLEKEAEESGAPQGTHLSWISNIDPSERFREQTITPYSSTLVIDNKRLTLIDVPGAPDLVPSMIPSVAQADFAVLVVNAKRKKFEKELAG